MKWMIVLVFLFSGLAVAAQSFDEWFRQKSTQLKYLKQQIAALEAYRAVTEEGYQLIADWTQLIGGIKKGDIAMHKGHFDSLKVAKPAIRGSPIVKRIGELDAQTSYVAGEALKATKNEVVVGFFQGLARESAGEMEWMKMVVGDGVVELTDEDRLEALSMIAERMKKRLNDALRVMKMIGEMKLNGEL